MALLVPKNYAKQAGEDIGLASRVLRSNGVCRLTMYVRLRKMACLSLSTEPLVNPSAEDATQIWTLEPSR